MGEVLEMTVDINKELWEKMKKLSGGLEDTALLNFLFQIGEYILEAIDRKSVILEMNGETKCEEAIDFGDLLDQYGLEDMDDFIEKAKPDDFI